MKKILFLIIVFSIFLLGFKLYFDSKEENEILLFEPIETGTTFPGEVSIELTPREIINGNLYVDLAVNTHSIDLTQFNLMELTILEKEGSVISPIEVPQLNGHHSSGQLVFEIGNNIEQFKIVIRNIPKIEERIFEWR